MLNCLKCIIARKMIEVRRKYVYERVKSDVELRLKSLAYTVYTNMCIYVRVFMLYKPARAYTSLAVEHHINKRILPSSR